MKSNSKEVKREKKERKKEKRGGETERDKSIQKSLPIIFLVLFID